MIELDRVWRPILLQLGRVVVLNEKIMSSGWGLSLFFIGGSHRLVCHQRSNSNWLKNNRCRFKITVLLSEWDIGR